MGLFKELKRSFRKSRLMAAAVEYSASCKELYDYIINDDILGNVLATFGAGKKRFSKNRYYIRKLGCWIC